MEKIFIWGASGQGRVVLDILRAMKKYEIIGFLDSNPKIHGKLVHRLPVLGGPEKLTALKKQGVSAGIVAIGNNQARGVIAKLLRQRGFTLINAVHPSAVISPTARLGQNVTVAAGAIISTAAKIGDDVIINSGAIIEHDNVIRTGAHIAPGTRLAGKVTVGASSFIGIGAVVIQYVKIGRETIIGAGAIVLQDIPDRVVAFGAPAKVTRPVTSSDLKSI